MSHSYYTQLWLVTRSDMEKLLDHDRQIQQQGPVRKKETALNQALLLYLKYRNIVKRLVVCYNQMVQTQKRELIRRVLDCAIGRMLEYKREVVNMDCTYYQWSDDLMNQLKFTPDDISISTPQPDKEHLQQRRKYIQELLENVDKPSRAIRERSLSAIHIESMTDLDDSASRARLARRRRPRPEESAKEVQIYRESPKERAAREARMAAEKALRSAVLLIQSHERARAARCVGARARRLHEYKKKVASGEIIPRKMGKSKYVNAAVTIQRAWRRYAGRKAMKRRIERIEEMLDMTIPSWKSREIFKQDEENFRRRLELVSGFAARTEKAISDERTRLLRIRGPGLMEDITNEIREWFVMWYNELGYFGVFPPANLGGSVLIVTGQTQTPQEFLLEQMEKMKAAEKAGKGTKSVAEEKEATKEESKKEKEAKGWIMPETEAFSRLETANQDFIVNWSLRDESTNPEQKEYLDLITDKLCYELQLEMREIVDELMRLELEKLNQALMKDYAENNVKFAIPTVQAAQKTKKPKGARKKGKQDILGDTPVEELFNELVRAKIIRNYPVTTLEDWFGDFSYQNYEARYEFRDYGYRLGEIKQVVMEYCVLPLTSKEVHRIAPLTRSVCICGLPRSGKTFLTNAICSEVGALLFDITPHVLADKFLGKKNEQRLIEMIAKVSRIYAPSVILVDSDKPWQKKLPPEEKFFRPKRFAPYYPRLVKSIKPGDQVLFVSTSSEPWKTGRPFLKLHDKFIIIPITDYNTLYVYYKNLLMKYHGVDRNIDVSCLAKISVGIPLEYIKEAIERVLSLRRRIALKFRPLKPEEIMEEVIKYKIPIGKTLEQLEKFEARTPLGRKRMRMLAAKKAESELGKSKRANG